MKIEEAKTLLDGCLRSELQDHAFGDAEVFWYKDGQEVASGYFAGSVNEVYILSGDVRFTGTAARELRDCGKQGVIERNDSTGPVTYSEGVTLPALTLEGVREELEN